MLRYGNSLKVEMQTHIRMVIKDFSEHQKIKLGQIIVKFYSVSRLEIYFYRWIKRVRGFKTLNRQGDNRIVGL